MKKVILMRHAKSDWADASQTDHQRGLNNRGKRDAPFMAQRIIDNGIIPDLMLVSDAQRTRDTWELIKDKFPNCKTIYSNDLYLASPQTITKHIKKTDNLIDTVLVLAHNPGITEAFYSLANVEIDNVPTAGVGCISFMTDDFKKIEECKTKLDYFTYPKMG
jgi:phosphohistidine phosphatase